MEYNYIMFNIKPNTGEVKDMLTATLINLELGNNETRAHKFLRNANELLDLEATIIHCPECINGYVREKSCHCAPNPAGCSDCDYTGYIKEKCYLCKGEGEVLMHTDGRIEVLI
jgi:hypothetical protein